MRRDNKYLLILLILSIVIIFIFNSAAHAVPAAPVIQELAQPDGTRFKAKVRGDERLHWHETEEGYTIIKDKATKWWHYAVDNENRQLIMSRHKVGAAEVGKLDIKRGLLPLRKQYRVMPAGDADLNPLVMRKTIALPHTQNLIVIMVDFNNVAGAYTPESFGSLFFSSTTKSVADYYKEVSYGKFKVTAATDTYGVTAGIIGWLRLNQNHPDCENAIDSIACYELLVSNTLQAADPYISFSSFDSNGDNSVTPEELSIIIIAAGNEEAYGTTSGPGVWAHQWQLSTPLTLDGKTIKHYAIFGEKHDSHQATIGVMVHELGHLMLDLPDLYDIEGNSSGIGYFDLMSKGCWCESATDNYSGQTPVHLSAWSKEYVGFVTPTVITDQKAVSLTAVSGSSADIVRVPTQNANEYFLVENRYLSGYDLGLQGCLKGSPIEGGGLAIWHIDKSLLTDGCNVKWNNCNANKKHRLVDLEEADGTQDLDTKGSSKLQDLFYAGNNISFNDATTPNSKSYTGTSNNVEVTNISSYGVTMTADIKAFSSTPIAPANQLLNAGLESGKVNWSEFSSGGYNVITQDSQSAFGGSWYAGFGGFNNGIEYVYQDVLISSNAVQAFLQFWYYISEEGSATNTTASDTITVEIRDPTDNSLLKTLAILSNLDHSSGWVVSEQYNLYDFAGRTVRLRFYATNSNTTKTLFLIDNVSLMILPTGNGMPSPAYIENYAYTAVTTPVLSSDPAAAKPFATGDINSGMLNLSAGFTTFNSPVDLYLGIYAPAYGSETYIIKADNSLQPASSGLTKWRENTLGPIAESLYGNIPLSSLLPGIYYLYTAVTPAGSLNAYYLWSTSFTVP